MLIVKGPKIICHANINQRKTVVAVLITDIVFFRKIIFPGIKDIHFIVIKGCCNKPKCLYT